jgi:hypothetical protein
LLPTSDGAVGRYFGRSPFFFYDNVQLDRWCSIMSRSNVDTRSLNLLWTFRLIFVGLLVVGLGWAGIAVLNRLREPSARNKSLAHAKQIHLALAEYAIDYDGQFPRAGDDSNSAYRQLFGSGFDDERLFYVPGSAWHDSLPEGAKVPNGEIGTAPDFNKALEEGENHWAYVNGLNNGSRGTLPLIVDGLL